MVNQFIIPKIGMSRGQAIEVQQDVAKHRCNVCARHGKCDVLGKGDRCTFLATDQARVIVNYLESTAR